MAVEFNDNSFVITVPTGGNPMEDWLGLHEELLEVLSVWDSQSNIMENPCRMLWLIQNMMPDWETAKKMHPDR